MLPHEHKEAAKRTSLLPGCCLLSTFYHALNHVEQSRALGNKRATKMFDRLGCSRLVDLHPALAWEVFAHRAVQVLMGTLVKIVLSGISE